MPPLFLGVIPVDQGDRTLAVVTPLDSDVASKSFYSWGLGLPDFVRGNHPGPAAQGRGAIPPPDSFAA